MGQAVWHEGLCRSSFLFWRFGRLGMWPKTPDVPKLPRVGFGMTAFFEQQSFPSQQSAAIS